MKTLYAIFGGNFDPIHYGHIYLAQNLAKNIYIKKIILVPNNNPPHRNKTKTSITDKINMIQLAVYNNSLFKISYLETKENKIFYTIDTLQIIRKKIGYLQPLCFIIGEDHLSNFNTWKDWKEILSYSHLLVCSRIHKKQNNYELKNWVNSHITNDILSLHNRSYGLIFLANTPIINISSSQIRNNYFHGKSSYGLLPFAVHKYIILKKIYHDI